MELKDMIIEACGEKWVATFDMPDGTKNMGMTNSHKALATLVNDIRVNFLGKNIVITDHTMLFCDKEEE